MAERMSDAVDIEFDGVLEFTPEEASLCQLLEQLDQMRDRAFKAEDAIARVRALCSQSRAVISRGCTCYADECSGTCGAGRPLGWDLDPAEVVRALDGER